MNNTLNSASTPAPAVHPLLAGHPVPELIETLEGLLEMAKSGRLQSIMGTIQFSDWKSAYVVSFPQYRYIA